MRKLKRTLPGDPLPANSNTQASTDDIESMIRVNHAGEYGAKRIYQGQLDVLGDDPELKETLEHMLEQELEHLEYFENEIVERNIRPTALHPLWDFLGYKLGQVTARISPEAAMACTVAVETVISEHYQEQMNALKKNKKEQKLYKAIKKFKEEEEEHHDIGIENHAEDAIAYPLLSRAIKTGSKLAIKIAKRI